MDLFCDLVDDAGPPRVVVLGSRTRGILDRNLVSCSSAISSSRRFKQSDDLIALSLRLGVSGTFSLGVMNRDRVR